MLDLKPPSSSCFFSLNRAWGVFAVVLLVANVGVFLYATERSRQEVVKAKLQGALAQAQVLEAHLHYSLSSIKTDLLVLRRELQSERFDRDAVAGAFQRSLQGRLSLEALFLVDEKGEVLVGSDSRSQNIDGSKLDHFVPVKGAVEPFSLGYEVQDIKHQRIFLMLGPFSSGTPYSLVAVVNSDYFFRQLEIPIDVGQGAVDVLLSDGRLLFSSQHDRLQGTALVFHPDTDDVAEEGVGTLGVKGKDEVPVLVAYAHVSDLPLTVLVHMDREQILGAWSSRVGGATRLAVGMLLLLVPITLLFLRERRILALKAQAVSDLQASEERYRLTFAANKDGTWDWDVRTGLIRCNENWYLMLGYTPDAFPVTLEKWWSMLHPDDRVRFQSRLRELLGSPEGFTINYRLACANGEWIWMEARGKAVSFEAGKPVRVIGSQADISARMATEEALSAAARYRTALLDRISAGVFLSSPERIILEVNSRGAEMFGYGPGELLGQSYRCLHVDEAHFLDFAKAYDKMKINGEVHEEIPFRRKDGSVRWISISGTHMESEAGTVIWTMLDITYRHQIQEALRASNQRLEVIINQFPGGLMVEDSARHVVLLNRAFCQLFFLEALPEGVIGEDFGSCVTRICHNFKSPEDFERQLRQLGEGLKPVLGREHKLEDGRILEQDYQPILEEGELIGRLWVFRDVSEQKALEQELRRLASVDSLTGLPNRRVFMERLELEVARLSRYGQGDTGLMMLDLDHFKQVNDRYGHGVGDQVLKSFGVVLLSLLRRTDLAGRLGGEEFGVLLPGVGLEGTIELAERLRQALAAKTLVAGEDALKPTISIGVTMLVPGDSANTALNRSDQALYQAKQGGRNRVETITKEGEGRGGALPLGAHQGELLG